MVMTTGTTNRQSKKSHPRGIGHVIHLVVPCGFEFLFRQLSGKNARTEEARSTQGHRVPGGNLVAC